MIPLFRNHVLFFILLILAQGFTGYMANASEIDLLRQLLRQGEQATVIKVIDGDTVILDRKINGANQIRLVGIQAPKLPLGRVDFPVWPLAEASKTALEKIILGRNTRLFYGGSEMDRHGRLLAHLFDDTGKWIQGEMLRQGMARVYTFADNRSITDHLYKQEHTAQAEKTGIWGHPFYKIRHSDNLKHDIGTFQIIEGRVRHVAKVKSKVYLNFGDDWRSDFTITLESKARKLFKKQNNNPLDLEGKSIRVRGWLKKRNGPMIVVTHPEQIENLSP